VDGEGLSGLELGLNDLLQSQDEPVALSIDMRVQHALRDELSSAMEEFGALAAAGVVMNVNTGEVLALVSLPDFDPHDPTAGSAEARLNRVTGGVFELGSVVKPLTIAQALELDLITPDTMFDVSQPLNVAGHNIRDFHRIEEPIPVREILGESSNIGTAEIAALIGRERQQDFLRELGFFDQQSTEMPGAAYPLVPENWGPLETATISFGHGLSVTPLHLTTAIAALVNGGYMIEPTFTRGEPGSRINRRRVISEETSFEMRELLRNVVSEGTGGNADVPGYEVAGKTGTSEKPSSGGGYDRDRLLSSFVGTFPASNPELVVFAMLDEPHATDDTYGFATGGWTVAPAVGRIIERIAPLTGVMPVDMETRSELVAAEGEQLATLSPQ
jgi:cell division protein FtsI (penicillin-binding protein 3)